MPPYACGRAGPGLHGLRFGHDIADKRVDDIDYAALLLTMRTVKYSLKNEPPNWLLEFRLHEGLDTIKELISQVCSAGACVCLAREHMPLE
jgi:hypothetical protein